MHRLPMQLCCTIVCVLALLSFNAIAQDQFVDVGKGIRLRYIEQGTGEPIVLLHGGGATNSADDWPKIGILQNLAANYRVIAFDARGYGKSTRPRDAGAYGREVTLDVARLLDHLKIDRAHVIGYSGGATTTAQLLTIHPQRVASATLIAHGGYIGTSAEQKQSDERDAAEMEKECISRSRTYRLAPMGEPRPSEEVMQARIAECMKDPNVDRFATAARTRARLGQAFTAQEAAAVTVPTIGIVGDKDEIQAYLKKLKEVRPTLDLMIVPGATHSGEQGILRHPTLLPTVRAFLQKNRLASR